MENIRNPLLYRLHCREMIDRVYHGVPLHLPTDAEILAVIAVSATWIGTPLNQEAAVLYRLFFLHVLDGYVQDDELVREIAAGLEAGVGYVDWYDVVQLFDAVYRRAVEAARERAK